MTETGEQVSYKNSETGEQVSYKNFPVDRVASWAAKVTEQDETRWKDSKVWVLKKEKMDADLLKKISESLHSVCIPSEVKYYLTECGRSFRGKY